MKKKHFTLVFLLLLAASSVNAQQTERFNSEKDKQITKEGYTIHLIPSPGNTFGFTIDYGHKPIWVQFSNPLVHTPMGFKSKADAYKVAEWIIHEHENGRPLRNIPPGVAQQLNITSDMPNIKSSTIKR